MSRSKGEGYIHIYTDTDRQKDRQTDMLDSTYLTGQSMKLIVLIKKQEKFSLWPVIFIKTVTLIGFIRQENLVLEVLKK